MASLSELYVTVDCDIRVKVKPVPMWRLKILGWIARLLRIPLTVEANFDVR